MKAAGRKKLDQRAFLEQVHECRDNGYLLSSKKIGSGAFSKVYLAYATQERMRHNSKLASDLRGKRHTMVAIKIVSTAEAPAEFSRKFLPREISSLNATYKHLNVVGRDPRQPALPTYPRPAPSPPEILILGLAPFRDPSPVHPRALVGGDSGGVARQVQLYETFANSRRTYLVLELAAHGDLLEHINATSAHRRCPGLEEEEARRLLWQLVSAVAHCHNSGIVHRDLKCENILLDDRGCLKLSDFGFANRSGLKNSLLSTFCGSVAYTAPEILMSKKYNGEQADLWSLGVILYAMVTGKLPFKECQPHRMLYLMRRGPTFRPGLSPECQDLIRGLLQLRPRARLALQQVATHHWMLPAAHALFCTTLCAIPEKPEKPQLQTSLDNVEPSADSDPPRSLLQLWRPQLQGTSHESQPCEARSQAGPAEGPQGGGTWVGTGSKGHCKHSDP
ncbi:testis-specific serine/threonine-protein kinase 5-like [Bos indicus x Bos taurus]|uniref:testis-specific serine/threonine-protein kinase 5-like n=1 Tax=Bos indicus x Bos taurus TaxID=30522 RepID=UPI000F7D16E2|nr:testis-specific serine/threonine-protein kinase 5-like [Bos indicus x Bos taurus]